MRPVVKKNPVEKMNDAPRLRGIIRKFPPEMIVAKTPIIPPVIIQRIINGNMTLIPSETFRAILSVSFI
jgi:formate-dependent phosphoribosylglycinamide formyltransferase (GAR transformylase)